MFETKEYYGGTYPDAPDYNDNELFNFDDDKQYEQYDNEDNEYEMFREMKLIREEEDNYD